MDILKSTTDWAKAELISTPFFILFGLLFMVVYVIWVNDDFSLDNLIYVGMTGKYKRVNEDEVVFNSSSFEKRNSRWTPYRFCESVKDGEHRFSFRFGPLESNVDKQSKIKYQDNTYNKTIP